MTLEQIIEELDLTLLTVERDFGRITPVACAPRDGALWVTLQAHGNIVAVGAVLGLSAIIVTEGETPDPDTIAKANEVGITLLSTKEPTFSVVGHLWRLGLRNDQ